jgi:hypothetical protein
MTWEWWVWLGLIAITFGLLESRAFRHPDRQWTLSRTVATAGAKWPLSIGLWGMFFGGLLVHFFWHFCPPGVMQGIFPTTHGPLALLSLIKGG